MWPFAAPALALALVVFGLTCVRQLTASAASQGFSTARANGSCFSLLQGGRVLYRAGAFNGTNSAISLRFHSYHNEGVILYIGGLHGDYMGLFLTDGQINYFIFNPSRLDMPLRGIHIRGDAPVELNRNYLVEFSFNHAQHQAMLNRHVYSTSLRMDGRTLQLFDYHIPDVQLQAPIYFGGGPADLNLHVLDFEGRLTDIRVNDEVPESVEINHRVTHC